MSFDVVVAETAERQLHVIDAWWRFHRTAAADLFAAEVADAFETLATHPGVGAKVRSDRVEGLRRILLRATRYHVYYVATARSVVVLAIWSAVRGVGPPIPMLAPPS